MIGLRPRAELFTLSELSRLRRRRVEARIRALAAAAYLGGGEALCRVLGRYKMFVDTADVGLSPHLLLDGYWEMWLTEALADTLRRGLLAVDVGANLGYFTLLMGDKVGPGGRVHAFEVNAAMADRARRSADLNGFGARTTVHQQALGEEDGRAFLLKIPAGEPKNAHIVPAPSGAEDSPDLVRTRRMDSYPELLDVDVVKIDVEGAEEAIWAGMAGIFARGRSMTVFLEYAPVRYPDPGAFLDAITAQGFSLAYLHYSRGVLPATREEVANGQPDEDRMLVLRR